MSEQNPSGEGQGEGAESVEELRPSQVMRSPVMDDPTKPSPAAQAMAEGRDEAAGPKTVTLSNGVVVRLRPVPPFLLNAALGATERPRPPVIDINGRQEENPNDPAFLAASQAYTLSQLHVIIDLMIVAGIEVVSLPDTIIPFDSDEWTKVAKRFKVTIADNEDDRRLQWMKIYVLTSQKDIDDTVHEVQRMSGLTEREVAKAIASFRSRKVGGADNGVRDPSNGVGDRVPEAVARDGASGGGDGGR